MMIDRKRKKTQKVTKRNQRGRKVDDTRVLLCAPEKRENLCREGCICCCSSTRNESPDGILYLFFFFCSCLWVCVFSYYYYLTGLAEVCFFFVSFLLFSFDYFRSIVVNCVAVFTFSQTAHNNQRISFMLRLP